MGYWEYVKKFLSKENNKKIVIKKTEDNKFALHLNVYNLLTYD